MRIFLGPPGLNGAPGLPGDAGMFNYWVQDNCLNDLSFYVQVYQECQVKRVNQVNNLIHNMNFITLYLNLGYATPGQKGETGPSGRDGKKLQ